MELPVEIVDHIISFLPYYDLLQFALTCKDYHRKLNKPNYQFLYHHIKVAKHLANLIQQFSYLYRTCQERYGTKEKLTRYLYKCKDISFNIYHQLYQLVEKNVSSDACEYFNINIEEMYSRSNVLLHSNDLKVGLENVITDYFKFDKYIREHLQFLIKGTSALVCKLNRMFNHCSKLQELLKRDLPPPKYNSTNHFQR